jgi:hypothetical protein
MKREQLTVGSILGAALLLAVTAVPARGQASRAELLKNSDIVFVGTVDQVGAASFPGVPISSRTVVVRVDTVLQKAAAVALAQGDKITVEVKDPSPFQEGVQATFYAVGWILGEGIAVREVGHEISPVTLEAGAISQKREEIMAIGRELSDAELRARIQAADVVIVGRVVRVGAETIAAAGGPTVTIDSEHAPQWQEAIIRVESAIKGAEAGQEIVLRFPASDDVAWFQVPKFKEGQERTFILQKDQVSGTPKAMLAGAEVNAYTALKPQDALSRQEAERVRTLAKE